MDTRCMHQRIIKCADVILLSQLFCTRHGMSEAPAPAAGPGLVETVEHPSPAEAVQYVSCVAKIAACLDGLEGSPFRPLRYTVQFA